MATVIEAVTAEEGENRVILGGIDWEVYDRLREAAGSRNVRMTYVEGDLELMSPSKLHERIAELLAQLVIVWTEEKNIPRQSCGTMTFRRKDLRRGLEPDKCFYIQNEQVVRNRDELDLTSDPPPDLVVEVDIASSSRDRLPIYAALGVPEVWRWRSGKLTPLLLNSESEYEECPDSRALSGFPFDAVAEVLSSRHAVDETSLIREFRNRVRGEN